jgi:hypothetical protein
MHLNDRIHRASRISHFTPSRLFCFFIPAWQVAGAGLCGPAFMTRAHSLANTCFSAIPGQT